MYFARREVGSALNAADFLNSSPSVKGVMLGLASKGSVPRFRILNSLVMVSPAENLISCLLGERPSQRAGSGWSAAWAGVERRQKESMANIDMVMIFTLWYVFMLLLYYIFKVFCLLGLVLF